MEGKCSNKGEWEGKGKAISSDDVDQGTIISAKKKGSENKYSKGKEMAEGSSSWDSQEKIPEGHPSPVAVPDPVVENIVSEHASSANVSSLPPVSEVSPLVPKMNIDFPCRYCTRRFPSAQGLGGHQNSHKKEREHSKRQRMHGYMPHSSSSLVDAPIYPDYSIFSNGVSLGYPQLPLRQANSFTLARPSSHSQGHPYSSSLPFSPNTKYPQLTSGLNVGEFGQPSNMWFNCSQLSGYDRFITIGAHPGNNDNDNQTSGNTRSDFNSLGMEHNEGGSLAGGILTVKENNCLVASGFEAGGTCSGDRNFLGLSQGESTVSHEIQDTIKEYEEEESDGTIDLLSRVGMCNTEDADAELNVDCVNQLTRM
ncbi:hypothetical protein Lser_V15G09958 [Lactuca serriola]